DISYGYPDYWLWDFGDGTTSTDANPTHVYTTSGSFTVSLTATNSYASDTETKTNFITVSLPASPTTTGASSCGPASLTLTAAGSGTLAWYSAATGGTQVTTGTSYTQNFTATTTYYVENQVTNMVSYYAGPANNSIGAGGYFTSANAHGLYFNAEQAFVLKSVYVYASTTGNRTITLKNSAGTTIATKTVNITSTTGQRVTLDFNIPVGTGYQLMGPTSPNLYRNTAGGNYPYTLAGVLSIYGNSANDLAYYYYFYDWEVQINQPCISARVPVTATINTIPADVTVSGGGTVCGTTATLTATGGTGGTIYYQGTTNNGTSTTTASSTQTVSANGTYYFRAQSAAGCWGNQGSATVTLNTPPTAVIVSG
ncbi:MAG TPA: PKD domain-containing protein, partial [Bacteroidales bacterium]|nr:PKD domain-containing protein [Bacteroidales bacterium]